MSYVPERITDYPQDIDDCPLHIDAEKLREAVEKILRGPYRSESRFGYRHFRGQQGVGVSER